MGCMPAHAMFFSIYEWAKIFLNCDQEDNTHRFALVGAMATLFHDSIMTPTEVIKQRLQIYRTEVKWISTHELIANIYKSEGLVSFYRSFAINYLMNVPFSSMIILMNEKLKKLMNVKGSDHHLNYYLCGGIAGGLASIPSTPFDVIKTRLNTQADLNT
jgi:solute carrier family 25 iron transporter 28/37